MAANVGQGQGGLILLPNIRAMIEEGKELSREDYRPIAVTLRATLSSTTTSADDTYKAPSTHKFLITQVLPHVVLAEPTDAAELAGLTTHHFIIRQAWKASNCRIQLTQDDSQENILGENRRLSLASLLASAGGAPLDWKAMPYILSPAETVRMTATLVTTGAAYADGDTEYGVVLAGALVRVRSS